MKPRHLLIITREMASSYLFQALFTLSLLASSAASNSKLFREYIGAEFTGVTFPDVPINAAVDFHFILSFAIDYPASGGVATPTNGEFNAFWDTDNLSPAEVAAIKQSHPNVKVALSIGGDSVQGGPKAYFSPSSIDSWVSNAVSSLTNIIREYDLDGVDVDYEHFSVDSSTFAECIGQLLTTLKSNGVISFASIAPYDDEEIQSYYLALWRTYSSAIDYVNFQFYGYPNSTTVSQFLSYFEEQSSNYNGGKVLVSISTDEPYGGDGGLSPQNGFFTACSTLQQQGELNGIFIWTADTSMNNGFVYETQAQNLLAS